MRPLAQYLGVKWMVPNRLEFRDGIATGRLLDPVIRPRGIFARSSAETASGRSEELTARSWHWPTLRRFVAAIFPAARKFRRWNVPIVHFDGARQKGRGKPLSVRTRFCRQTRHADWRNRIHRQSVAGEHADGSPEDRSNLSADPAAEIESGAAGALKRWWKNLRSSIRLFESMARAWAIICAIKLKSWKAMSRNPALGLDRKLASALAQESRSHHQQLGLDRFQSRFAGRADHQRRRGDVHSGFRRERATTPALLHLSTCYVAGERDGRVSEKLSPNYTPHRVTRLRRGEGMAVLCTS